jgi:uncharacterized peroxidase-related enzyme
MGNQSNYLGEPPENEATRSAYERDRAEDGYVWNVTRLWSWRNDFEDAFVALRSSLLEGSVLTDRETAVLNTAAASARRDSYCSLAWGPRLAALPDDETAAATLAGREAPALTERESALANWARQVVAAPGETNEADVERLRNVGLDDQTIFEATAFIALRLAFSTINGALGAAPDRQLAHAAPRPIRAAVDYGRPPSAEPSRP